MQCITDTESHPKQLNISRPLFLEDRCCSPAAAAHGCTNQINREWGLHAFFGIIIFSLSAPQLQQHSALFACQACRNEEPSVYTVYYTKLLLF